MMINTHILNRIPSEQSTGLAPHSLVLKVNCIVLLIRKLNSKEALVNRTRMRIKCMHVTF